MTAIRNLGRIDGGLKRLVIAALLAGGLSLGVAASASAHGLTVQTPQGDTVVSQPVSTDWAQAHCNAESPARIADRGAATFSPPAALPCPTGPGEGAPGRN